MDEALASKAYKAQSAQPTAKVDTEPAAAKEEVPPVAEPVAAPEPKKRSRGRPPGSKNKPRPFPIRRRRCPRTHSFSCSRPCRRTGAGPRAHAAVADDLRDDVVAQRAHRVGRVGQAAASEIELGVRLHLHEGEDLTGAVDEARAQEVVDALGRGVWKLAAELLVVQDGSIAVVEDGDLVGGLYVSGGGKVAADPGRKSDARVCSDRKLRPVERSQGLVLPDM